MAVLKEQKRFGTPREGSDVVPLAIAVHLERNVQRAAKIDAATKKCLLRTTETYFENDGRCIRPVRQRLGKNSLENGQI